MPVAVVVARRIGMMRLMISVPPSASVRISASP